MLRAHEAMNKLVKIYIIYEIKCIYRSWDNSVGTVTCYGLDGMGIESRWGVRFSTRVQTSSEAHPASYTMGTGSFLGVKWMGHSIDQPPPSSTGVNERVQL